MRALAVSLGAALLLTTPSFADELEGLSRAIDEHPDDSKAYDAYALAAIREKRFDDAIRRLKIGVARIADYSEGYYKLAYAYRQKREWAEAAACYRRYVALNPERPDPYFGLGAALEGLGDRTGATAAYEKYVALEKAPEKQRFVDQAKTELAKLQEVAPSATSTSDSIAPSPSSSLRTQAEALRREGKLEKARLLYEKAIAAEPNNLGLYSELGNVQFALKQYAEAVRLFQDATAKQPNFALGWYYLAHALRKSERPKEAADAYRQYIKLRPEDPDPYFGLAQTLKSLGDVKGAIEAFHKYLDLETRAAEQRWVDKARAELQALEAMQKGGASSSPPSTLPSPQMEQELPRLVGSADSDALLPMSDETVNPFTSDHDLVNLPSEASFQQYRRAIAAYRHALAHHTEEVLERYERGLGLAMAANVKGAEEVWNGVSLSDPQLEMAWRAVEQAREALTSSQK